MRFRQNALAGHQAAIHWNEGAGPLAELGLNPDEAAGTTKQKLIPHPLQHKSYQES
jgi:hypothetical protein